MILRETDFALKVLAFPQILVQNYLRAWCSQGGYLCYAQPSFLLRCYSVYLCGGVTGAVLAAPATYHVMKTGSDSNSCSSGAPCLTIARGLNMLSAGDTLVIHAGTYAENNLQPPGGKALRGRLFHKVLRMHMLLPWLPPLLSPASSSCDG